MNMCSTVNALCLIYFINTLLEPGKEIETTTNKSTALCLRNTEFQPECSYTKCLLNRLSL